MKKTGFLYDERYLLHNTGAMHPESSERLKAAYDGIEAAGLLPKLTRISASRADQRWIESVHHVSYIMRFEEACLMQMTEFDYPDNQMCPETCETAFLAVGGILDTVTQVVRGVIDNAFCAVRPPGHHAEVGKAMGFCYFNNIAIAARYLQDQLGVSRIAIVDFDVHHGNGTQHIFEYDPTVFYYSIHEHPSFAYPGTGREFEKGADAGYGYTLNSPVLPGQGDAEYQALIQSDLIPALDFFEPEFILVSTGFDAHEDDDMSGIRLSTEGFSRIMETLMGLANQHTGGKIVSVLEGGYCIERLPELVKNHVEILLRG
ncbi:histone deacetylase [Desulfonema ishimotonii]|uniref:Histone deacetylase n=1 Tax=Desulfonema ishimotonii TaxID=45657 RepID=A0A401G0X3_9BACT|nr:histone deacetylase [Desulfonema ishimotonii]GBC62833.1 histone deacetylase [Desulfonema ishimotonii]